jgi:hypothetical protein
MNKNALFRYLCIDVCLRSRSRSTLSQLTSFCKMQLSELPSGQMVTRKVIKKDVADLIAQFSCPIETGNSFAYKSTDYTFLNVPPDTLHNLLQSIKLNYILDGSAKLNEVVQFDPLLTKNGIEHISTLSRAIISRRMIVFEYKALSDKKTKKQCVSPQLIKQCGTIWYLMGIKDGERGMRQYSLARFVGLATLSKRKSLSKAGLKKERE